MKNVKDFVCLLGNTGRTFIFDELKEVGVVSLENSFWKKYYLYFRQTPRKTKQMDRLALATDPESVSAVDFLLKNPDVDPITVSGSGVSELK